MNSFYWLEIFLWFPKKDVTGSRGYIRDQGVTITHVYSTKAKARSG
jgi:hypothetical protein